MRLKDLLGTGPDLGEIAEVHLREVLERERMDRRFVTPPAGVKAPKVVARPALIKRPHLWKPLS